MRTLIGFLLLFFGLSYLGAQFGLWQALPWAIVFHFWPVLLIFLGLSMIVTDRVWLVVLVLAFLIGVAALYVFRPDVAGRFNRMPRSWSWDLPRGRSVPTPEPEPTEEPNWAFPPWMRDMMPGYNNQNQ